MKLSLYSIRWIVLTLVVASCQLAYASNFGDATTKGVKVILDSGTQSAQGVESDLLVMKTPNSYGISVNDLSAFSIDKPLKIANIAASYGTSFAAKLIIIRSPSITLNSHIEIVGETADILLVSSSGSAQVNCNNCGFKNAGRVTLAAGTSVVNSGMSAVGDIKSLAGAKVNVNSLVAENVDSVELIGNDVTTAGTIRTNMRAVYHPSGGYEIHPQGGLVVGSGGVNIYSRNIDVNYESLTIQKASTSSAPLTINARVESATINIFSASAVTVAAQLNTKSDILATTVYRGKLSSTKEAINITTLGNSAANSLLAINAELKSDNDIILNTASDAYINAPVTAKKVELIAVNKVHNKSTISAFSSSIVADNIENNGTIKGTQSDQSTVALVAVKDINNSYGGKIFSSTISLKSQNGLIRNGSQFPYRPATQLVLKAETVESKVLDTLSPLNYAGATKVSDLSAKIVGKNIVINSLTNVENINPYFVYTTNPATWSNGVPFDVNAVDRVVLIADEALNITAGQYVLNSSAIMGVNNPSATKKFIVNAPNIANKRYFVKVLADETNETTSSSGTNSSVTSTTTTQSSGIEANLYAYSPPGIIYSFAPLQFEFPIGSNGGFINNTSYFEALSDAYFAGAGVVSSIGLTLEKENYNFVTTTITRFGDCYRYNQSQYYGRPCVVTGTTNTNNNGTTVANDMERTLFSVAGNIYGSKSTFFGTNHQVLDNIKNDIINQYIAANSSTYSGETVDFYYGTKIIANSTVTGDLSADKKTIIFTTHYWEEGTAETDIYWSGQDYTYKSGEKSVWDLLKEKISGLKTAFLNALNALVSWLNG